MRLRTALGIDDDLQQFAQWFLYAHTGGLTSAIEVRDIPTAHFTVLLREGRFQVEMCVVHGDELIPEHWHPHADTIEVGVAGAVRLIINGRDPFAFVPDDRLAKFTRHRGIRINHDDRHGGRVLHGGAVFLSVQRWDGDPQSVITDFVEAAG